MTYRFEHNERSSSNIHLKARMYCKHRQAGWLVSTPMILMHVQPGGGYLTCNIARRSRRN